jgi:hypothetical protein
MVELELQKIIGWTFCERRFPASEREQRIVLAFRTVPL